jgi:hypothetical protein
MHKVVQVRIHEDEIGVYYGQAHIQSMPRLIGRAHHRVNYRHVIWSLRIFPNHSIAGGTSESRWNSAAASTP